MANSSILLRCQSMHCAHILLIKMRIWSLMVYIWMWLTSFVFFALVLVYICQSMIVSYKFAFILRRLWNMSDLAKSQSIIFVCYILVWFIDSTKIPDILCLKLVLIIFWPIHINIFKLIVAWWTSCTLHLPILFLKTYYISEHIIWGCISCEIIIWLHLHLFIIKHYVLLIIIVSIGI